MRREKAQSIIGNNIAMLLRERSDNAEKIYYELSELAYSMAEEIRAGRLSTETPYAFSDGVFHLLKPRTEEESSVLDEYRQWIFAEKERDFHMHTAVFSLCLAHSIARSRSLFPVCEKIKNHRIAYVRSPMAERAYAKVATAHPDTCVFYVSGAEEACAAVAASEADFALLPLAYRTGERLSAMEKLTERYKMHLNAGFRIFSETEGEILFGLFSLSDIPFFAEGDVHVELLMTAENYLHAAQTVSFLPLFGYEITGFTCTSAEYDRAEARVVLRGDGEENALWFFLALTVNGFERIGKYPILDA